MFIAPESVEELEEFTSIQLTELRGIGTADARAQLVHAVIAQSAKALDQSVSVRNRRLIIPGQGDTNGRRQLVAVSH